MLRGRGLQTINALPEPKRQAAPQLACQRPVRPAPTPNRRLKGPKWHVPGYEQLAELEGA